MPTSIHDSRYQALRREMVAVRKAAGLTQTDLATRLGVGQSFVSKIERGDAFVDVMLLLDWCGACGADTQHVLLKLTLARSGA